MNKLDKFTGLDQEISIYIPSTQKTGEVVQGRESIITNTQALLSSLFGGFTSTTAQGGWNLENGDLQRESVEVVSASASRLTDNDIDNVVDYAVTLCRELNQEAVSVKVNGKLHFITVD